MDIHGYIFSFTWRDCVEISQTSRFPFTSQQCPPMSLYKSSGSGQNTLSFHSELTTKIVWKRSATYNLCRDLIQSICKTLARTHTQVMCTEGIKKSLYSAVIWKIRAKLENVKWEFNSNVVFKRSQTQSSVKTFTKKKPSLMNVPELRYTSKTGAWGTLTFYFSSLLPWVR